VGDILYANTTTSLAKLADVATGNALISGGVGVAPAYGKIGLTTHVSGVLPVANGGTNASTASITSFNNITGYTASGATGTTSTNLVFSTSPSITTPTLVGDVTMSTGNLVVGTSGKGIDFSATPGTGTSELFADYEEGTYDVTIGCGTSGTVTLNSSFNMAQYTKVGRLVTVTGGVIVSSVASPVGFFTISLPFTSANLGELSGYFLANLTLIGVNTANIADFVSLGINGASSIRVYLGDGTSIQSDAANELKANSEIYFVISYIAA
jgi:hypothetical protein